MSNVPAGVQKVAARPAPPPPPRPHIRPPPPKPTGPIVQGPGGVQSVQVTENLQMRPTATRAVVLSRPLIPIARPAPRTPVRRRLPASCRSARSASWRSSPAVRAAGASSSTSPRTRRAVPQQRHEGPRVEADRVLSKQDLVAAGASARATSPSAGTKKKAAKKGAKTRDHRDVRAQEGASGSRRRSRVSELSQPMGVKASDLIRKLMQGGKMATINQPIDADTAALPGHRLRLHGREEGLRGRGVHPGGEEDKPESWSRGRRWSPSWATSTTARPRCSTPSARRTWRRARPAGSRSTSARTRCRRPKGRPITFLDTPGHEAFTAMRARGAQRHRHRGAGGGGRRRRDAADGRVDQPRQGGGGHHPGGDQQDRQAGRAARARSSSSSPSTSSISEEWGGDDHDDARLRAHRRRRARSCSSTSLLQAEVLELKANPNKPATGVVIEAKLEKGRGPVATVLVQDGTLRVGDAIVTGIRLRPRARDDERARRAGRRRPARVPGGGARPRRRAHRGRRVQRGGGRAGRRGGRRAPAEEAAGEGARRRATSSPSTTSSPRAARTRRRCSS